MSAQLFSHIKAKKLDELSVGYANTVASEIAFRFSLSHIILAHGPSMHLTAQTVRSRTRLSTARTYMDDAIMQYKIDCQPKVAAGRKAWQYR